MYRVADFVPQNVLGCEKNIENDCECNQRYVRYEIMQCFNNYVTNLYYLNV